MENQIRNNDIKHAYLFCGGAGTGKAEPLDNKLLTPTGYKRMGDIKIGDKVIDGLGKETTVTAIFPQGVKPIYRVTFSDRTSVLCSDEHLWKVGKYNKHKKCVEWQVKSVNDMLKETINVGKKLRYRIPLPIIDCWQDENIEVDAYVLGVLIGDGCITTNVRFANAESDIVNKVEDRLQLSGFTLHKVNQTDKCRCDLYDIVPIERTYSNQYNKTGFINKLKDLDLCKKSVDKYIPKNYLYSSVKTRIDLLQGLFDTDGFVDNKRARGICIFNTSSPRLSEDFAFLVRSLGGTDTVVKKSAGYRKDGKYIKCNDTYQHTIKFANDIVPFSSEKHTKKYLKPQNEAQRKIINIEYVNEQECQCIKVSSYDHTYITNNVTVTHNTTSARIIANMINGGVGKPIEIDCASHNSVDDVRTIQENCKTRPLIGKYKIFICDEAHMLTVQAWNSMLKILEEPPEYVVFMFCTTDPQKILPTILSRVQRFNFSRISTQGIVNRLIYIINNENNTNPANLYINYEPQAVDYIARLAKGGMRDSITTLEKCLDYSRNLTLDNVLKVTSGSITEDTLRQFLQNMLNGDCKTALLQFNSIYMTGIDINLFLKMYIEFLENCVKFIVTQNSTITTLSPVTISWLQQQSSFLELIRKFLLSAIEIGRTYNSEDLKIMIESWVIQECC